MSNQSPDLENGYLRIANELFDAILNFDFSKRQQTVVLAVIRKTYGYGKKSDDVTLSQLEEMTRIRREHISRTVNDLVAMGVLLKHNGRYGQILALVKNYHNWSALPKKHQRVLRSPQPQDDPVEGCGDTDDGVAKTATGVANLATVKPPDRCCQNSNTSVAKTAIEVLPKRQPQKTTPKNNPKKQPGSSDDGAKPTRKARLQPVGIKAYLAACKSEGRKPIPEDDPVFDYAAKVGIEREWLYLCWLEFKSRHIDKGKRQKSWPQTFRNCVRDNWYRLWFVDGSGQMCLTTQGVLAQRLHREAMQ